MNMILCGPMASGKTTLQKVFENHGYYRIVRYTTRPRRSNEEDGVDYHFVPKYIFEELRQYGAFVEWGSYNFNYTIHFYGSTWSAYLGSKDKVVVLNPKEIKILNYNIRRDSVVVYLKPSEEAYLKKALIRDTDTKQEIERRYASDKDMFKDFESRNMADITLFDALIATPEELYQEIEACLFKMGASSTRRMTNTKEDEK